MATATLLPPVYTSAAVRCIECGDGEWVSTWTHDDGSTGTYCADAFGCRARVDAQVDAEANERECGYCLDLVGPAHRCTDWIRTGVATGAFKNVEHYYATRE